jgi:predicted ArsR family transcriptional regulator
MGDTRDRQRSALAVPARRRVYALIENAADGIGIGIAELAKASGLHQNTVRLHVERLVEVGLVSQEQARPAGRGRPAYRYRAIEKLRDSAEDYRRLAGWLAEAVRTGSSARAVGRRVGEDERAMSASTSTSPSPDAVAAINDSFARLGFSPRRVHCGDGRDELVLHACPFAEAARDDPGVVCSLHRGIAEGLAGPESHVVVEGLEVVADPRQGGCRLVLNTRDCEAPA